MAVATTEPRTFYSGNTVNWNKSLSDYPADEYLLSYALVPISGGEAYEFSASASGELHLIRLSPATTNGYEAGEYSLIPTVTDLDTSGATTKITLDPIRVEIYPAATSEVDRRTYAEQIVQDLQDTYKKLAANSIQSATVNGRTYTRNNLADIRAEIIYWEQQVSNESGGAVRRVAVEFKKSS